MLELKSRTKLRRLEQGNLGDYQPVGEGVCELRIDYGPGYRVDFVQLGTILLVILAGGDKSTQDKDIATALTYWAEYKESQDV